VLASRARITYRHDWIVVETPDDPGGVDGNFLVLPRPAAAGELPRWIERFSSELGSHRAVSLRCDDASGRLADEGELRAAGFELDVHELLVVDQLSISAVPALPVRALAASEVGLAGELAWELADRHDEGYRAFLASRGRWLADMVARGRAHVVGAFDGAALVASLGIIPLGTIARFDQVQTHPAYRRRGLATALLALAARLCDGVDGRDQRPAGSTAESHRRARCAGRCGSIERFAILTEPDSPASRVYRRAGFHPHERTARAWRMPT
jgi:GNAT superfamily N-acetyltransferase